MARRPLERNTRISRYDLVKKSMKTAEAEDYHANVSALCRRVSAIPQLSTRDTLRATATLRAMQALYVNILPPMPTDYPRDYMDAPYQDPDLIKMGWKFGRI